jgi:copper chaperone CopZ
VTDGVKELEFQAEKISCSGCAEDMENILRDGGGILDAAVKYSDGSIRVTFDPNLIGRNEVISAVRRLGFPVKLVRES